jgi:leader peptidase (prepilin peptidase)/N-methyltransferase
MVEEIIIILVFGLAWGSFLNVVIYRLPLGMSLVKPPSSCPQCKRKIPFYDNIPFFSYLLLRGKCRECGAKIPVSYFLVEILTPLSFLLIYQKHSLSFFFVASCLFASAMIVLGFIDFYHQILPDEITLPGIVLALVYAPFRSDLNLTQALIGAVVGAGFLLFIYGAYFLLRKKEGLGMGDVTMMLLIGAYLGWKLTFFTLILASFVGAIVGVFFIFFRKKDFQYALPFGTFLAPAAYFSLLWGEPIIQAYLSLFRTP